MTLPNLPEVPPNPTTQQLAQVVGALVQELSYLLSGFLSSNNAREFGGWQIGTTELQSKTKTVGMSTEVTGADDIRFWAGDLKTGSPNFKVTESGIMSTVSGNFSSAAGYPRVEINSTTNLIAAFTDADSYISIVPDYSGSVPAMLITDAATTKGFLNRPNAIAGTTLGTFDGEPLNFQPSGDLKIGGVSGYNGNITYVKNVVAGVPSFGNIVVTKGIITSFT